MPRRFASQRTMLVLLILLAIPLLACNLSSLLADEATPVPTAPSSSSGLPSSDTAPQASGYIVSVLMAENTLSDAKEPVNPTLQFSPNAVFHAVVSIKDAPRNTQFKADWFVTDVGAVVPSDSAIDSTMLTSDGTRNLDFTLRPSAAWPAGKYRVEISVNNVRERIVDFVVGGSVAVPTRAGPSEPSPVPTSTGSVLRPSGYVSGITMALNSKGENKEAVNPTSVFQSNSVFHAIVSIQNAPKNTAVKATWIAVDVSNVSPNSKIDSTDVTIEGTRNVDFTLSPSGSWPAGTYRVEIYVNGTLDSIARFTVK